MTMNITFLSPLFPTDLKRQSLPFSYVDVSVSSSDGNSHDVQLYTDLTAGKPCNSGQLLALSLDANNFFSRQSGCLQTALLLLNGNTA